MQYFIDFLNFSLRVSKNIKIKSNSLIKIYEFLFIDL